MLVDGLEVRLGELLRCFLARWKRGLNVAEQSLSKSTISLQSSIVYTKTHWICSLGEGTDRTNKLGKEVTTRWPNVAGIIAIGK